MTEKHRAVIHIAHELSVESMKHEELPLSIAPELDVRTAFKNAYDACQVRSKQLVLPCVACKRAGVGGRSIACIANERFPIDVQYYAIPFCQASDACLNQAEGLRRLIGTLFPDEKKALHVCYACKEIERRGGRPFFPCLYCNEVYFCSLTCLGKGWEQGHQRACPRRPVLPPRRFPVEYVGILVLPGDDPGFAIVRGPDAMAPGDPAADATVLKETAEFALWFNMERTERRFALLQRVPRPWHCLCGRACTDPVLEKAVGVAILNKEPRWRLTQLIAPACSDACMTPLRAFLETCHEKITEQAMAAGDAAVCCSVCSLWPVMGKTWKTCAACHKSAYCSRECQVKAWPTHKAACASRAEM